LAVAFGAMAEDFVEKHRAARPVSNAAHRRIVDGRSDQSSNSLRIVASAA